MSAVIQNEYTGNGSTTTYSFTFPYLKTSDIKASLDGVDTTAFTLPNATTLQFNSAPASNTKIKIFRQTSVDSLTATFYAGSAIKSEDLNDNFTQNLYKTQEIGGRFISNLGGTMTGNFNLGEDADITFEGANDNNNETTLTVADPSQDNTITLPNVTGTVVTTGDTGTVARGMIANDAVNGTKINDDSIDSEHYVDGSIDTQHIADAQVTTAKLAGNAVTAVKLADGSVTNAKLGSEVVTNVKIADSAVETAKIANNAVTADKLAANSVLSANIANGTIVNADLADDCIANRHMVPNAINTTEIADGAVETAKLDDNSVTLAKMTDNSVGTSEIVNNAVTTDKIPDNAITMAKLASGTLPSDIAVVSANITDGTIATADIADNAVTTGKIQDGELKTLAGMPSGTASVLADSTPLTSTTAELNMLDGKQINTTINTNASHGGLPTSQAVRDFVLGQVDAVGGLVSIPNEGAFPETQPIEGVAVSIADAGGLVVSNTGTASGSTIVNSTTVNISGIPSNFRGTTVVAGVRFIVVSTGSSQNYTYHKATLKESDLVQLSDDINDFNERYRVGSSNPTSALDNGDLFFNTGTGKMLVYNGTNTAWEEVQSIGNFFISTLSPAFNGSLQNFTLSNAPTNVQQVLLSINGVIQKPNAGTSTPSEGFALDGSTIKLSAAPASGSDYFAVVMGSTVNIGTPSNNTVSSAILQNGSVITTKIADDAVTIDKIADGAVGGSQLNALSVSTGKIEDQAVTLAKLEHGTSSNNGKFLRANNGADPTFETVNTDLVSDTSPQLGGNLDSNTRDIHLNNSGDVALRWQLSGTNKWSIFHNTSGGANALEIYDNNGSKTAAKFATNGAAVINHSGNRKIETTPTGVYNDGKLGVNTSTTDKADLLVNNAQFHGEHFAYSNDRIALQTAGSLKGLAYTSTYNDGSYPGYGISMVQGPSTNLYNVWGFCPDGPARGSNLNLHYGGYSGSGSRPNIHTPTLNKFVFTAGGSFTPPSNGTGSLGTSGVRWGNIFTSDLSLSNEAIGGNDIDGTWGDWTIQEGESDLFLKNNRSGKKYKFNLTEVS